VNPITESNYTLGRRSQGTTDKTSKQRTLHPRFWIGWGQMPFFGQAMGGKILSRTITDGLTIFQAGKQMLFTKY
jgi:hypothetical protein